MYVLLERIEGLILIRLLVVLLHVYFNDLKIYFKFRQNVKQWTTVKIQFNNNTLLAFICEYIFIILL